MDEVSTKMQRPSAIGEFQERIAEWLGDEGFNLWKFPDEDAHFSYKVSRGDSHPLVVRQLKNQTDSIQIAGDVRVNAANQNKLQTIPDNEKRFLLFDFRMVLLSTGCRWQFLPSPESWETLHISKTVFYDGLTKDRFFEVLEVVTRAMSLVILTLEWKFNVTPYVS